MSLVWPDRTLETTTGNGTGPFVLAGAVAGYNAFSDGFSVADTCYGTVFAVDADGRPTGDWVTGLLTYSAANQITVTTVSKSSNADVAVEFTPGTKWVMACPIGDNIEDWQTAVTDALTAADIGVTVQAYSANLAEYAAVNPTAAGLALLDDADIAAQRTTLDVYSIDETDAAISAASSNGDGSATSGVVSGLGVAYSGAGLVFNMSAGTARINGVNVVAAAQSVTLAAADATHPRIDTFYVDDAGLFGKITGTAAANPSQPAVDPTAQLYLGFALVPATATDLTSGFTTETIYDEGAEWTATTSGSGFTVDSTNNPNVGTKCIEGTAVVSGAYVKFVDGSPTAFDSSGNLLLSIRSKATWNGKRGLTLQWFASGVAKGSTVAIREGSFGFSTANTSTYQALTIAKTLFSVPSGTTADELRITAVGSGGSAIGFYIDPIKSQSVTSGSGGSTVTGITQDQADARYLKLTGGTLTGDLVVPAEAYGVGWNGDNTVPTKNDVYDKIETVVAAGATRASLGLDTTDSPQFAALNIGAASDTTLARSGAGDLTIEGNAIYRAGGTDVAVADGGTGASDAATARTNLGLGTAAILAETTTAEYRANTADRALSTDQVWAAADYVTLNDSGGNIAVDMSLGFNFAMTMDGDYTLSNPTNTKNGQTGCIVFTQDGTGTQTLAYASNWKFAGGTDPTLSTAAGAVDVLFYQVISSTSIVGNLVKAIA